MAAQSQDVFHHPERESGETASLNVSVSSSQLDDLIKEIGGEKKDEN